MEVTQIPFAKHIGIERQEEGILKLEPSNVLQNHIQTIHASAQYALAETQSGYYLQKAFPRLENKVIGLLRGSTVKYKHPATTTITAYASVSDEDKERFLILFEKKGRASITVVTELRDQNDTITMQGEFNWFIQGI